MVNRIVNKREIPTVLKQCTPSLNDFFGLGNHRYIQWQ